MIDEPGRWLDEFLEAGCDSITIHVEVSEPIEPVLRRIRAAGRAAGLALRPRRRSPRSSRIASCWTS